MKDPENVPSSMLHLGILTMLSWVLILNYQLTKLLNYQSAPPVILNKHERTAWRA